jgi:phospholipid/cholesterol/gamma-HCH transport system substrate-binding protein
VNPRDRHRLSNPVVGIIAVVTVALAFYFAFARQVPWHHGYELKAVFSNAENLRVNSPVREAGVNVGKVTKVANVTENGKGTNAAIVTMEVQDKGRPIKQDATIKLRPRLFLEGNLFVDVHPGTPEAPEAPSGYTVPINQTSISVQFDQVLTSLQANTRADLDILLKELGDAFEKYGGAAGFNELYRTSPVAYKTSAQVNEALLGTQPHDLSGLIRSFDKVIRGLDANESQLKDLITNFRIVTGSFAAQSGALEQAIAELPGVLEIAQPALVHLNQAFPPLRAFAREILPGVRSTPATLTAATPFIKQVRLLVAPAELGGLSADLEKAVPSLALLSKRTIPFLKQGRALASCFNNVIIPWSNDRVQVATNSPDPATAGQRSAVGPVFKETGYGLAGVAGESRSGDANGQYIKVGAGGGANTLAAGGSLNFVQDPANMFGVLLFPIIGSEPPFASSAKTKFHPGVPCENQQKPDLRFSPTASPGPVPPQPRKSGSSTPPELQKLMDKARKLYLEGQKSGALKPSRQSGSGSGTTNGNGGTAAPAKPAALSQYLQDLSDFLKNDQPRYEQLIRKLTGYGGAR